MSGAVRREDGLMGRRRVRLRSVHLGALGAVVAACAAVALPRPGGAAPRLHESPRAYCARVGTDDTLRTPPAALAPTIRRLFKIRGHDALAAAHWRCAGGAVKVCLVGANLPCGKANTSKHLPAVAHWCETHPDSEFIPAFVTGHDSLYSWHCVGSKAATGVPHGTLDGRGFFADYWKTAQ
jgi:hypothetical protein